MSLTRRTFLAGGLALCASPVIQYKQPPQAVAKSVRVLSAVSGFRLAGVIPAGEFVGRIHYRRTWSALPHSYVLTDTKTGIGEVVILAEMDESEVRSLFERKYDPWPFDITLRRGRPRDRDRLIVIPAANVMDPIEHWIDPFDVNYDMFTCKARITFWYRMPENA